MTVCLAVEIRNLGLHNIKNPTEIFGTMTTITTCFITINHRQDCKSDSSTPVQTFKTALKDHESHSWSPHGTLCYSKQTTKYDIYPTSIPNLPIHNIITSGVYGREYTKLSLPFRASNHAFTQRMPFSQTRRSREVVIRSWCNHCNCS
jgi:hypothetical protein